MQFTRSLSHLNSTAGMSLLSVITGMAIMAVLALTSANILADAKKAEISGNVSSALNQAHLLNVYKIRSIAKIKQEINYGLSATQKSALSACLAGTGTGCTALNDSIFRDASDAKLHTIYQENLITIKSDVKFRIACATAGSCEAVHVQIVSTSAEDPERGYQAVRREVQFQMPGIFLGDKSDLSFACVSAGRVPTGIDQSAHRAICDGIRPLTTGCTNSSPVTSMQAGGSAGCAVMANANCPRGIRRIGLMNGQSTCL